MDKSLLDELRMLSQDGWNWRCTDVDNIWFLKHDDSSRLLIWKDHAGLYEFSDVNLLLEDFNKLSHITPRRLESFDFVGFRILFDPLEIAWYQLSGYKVGRATEYIVDLHKPGMFTSVTYRVAYDVASSGYYQAIQTFNVGYDGLPKSFKALLYDN